MAEKTQDIDRINSQYLGLDTTLISDTDLKNKQSGGIGVAAKIKSFNIADPANGINAFVVDAFDIDWKGYKIGDTALTSTGQLIQYISDVNSLSVSVWETYEDESTEETPSEQPSEEPTDDNA